MGGPIRCSLLTLKRKEHLKIYLREIGLEGVNWINLAEDRDRWRALVNKVMNFVFYKR
jgi:hypothetical protein